MPGFGTPLFFYLTDTIKLTPSNFGAFQALLSVSFLPTIALYGLLCRRFSLSKLLVVSMVIMLPQLFPLLFIHTPMQALVSHVEVLLKRRNLLYYCPVYRLSGVMVSLTSACIRHKAQHGQISDGGVLIMANAIWTIIVVLFVLWLLGFVMHFGGNLIHIALVIAVILVVYNLVTKGKATL